MAYSGKDYIGLGWFGQCIIHLIDAGQHESTETILKHMNDRTLVTYLLEKYETRFSGNYNLDALNEFFEKWAHYAEKRKSGVFGKDNGLLMVLSVILSETENQITNWT